MKGVRWIIAADKLSSEGSANLALWFCSWCFICTCLLVVQVIMWQLCLAIATIRRPRLQRKHVRDIGCENHFDYWELVIVSADLSDTSGSSTVGAKCRISGLLQNPPLTTTVSIDLSLPANLQSSYGVWGGPHHMILRAWIVACIHHREVVVSQLVL
jgi:hypothetical protein